MEKSLRIFGLDFTSRPTRKKPITCSVCEVENNKLSVLSFLSIPDFNSFESFCEAEGAWVAGMDFPFGMPHVLIDDLHYPQTWERYVAKFGSMTRQNFIDLLTDYKRKQPKGSKEHRRITDVRTGSLSPMKLYGVPVGKMFFEGAPRLAGSGASILPFVKRSVERIIIEAYPALVLTCINISYIVNSWARRKPDAQETTDTKMYGGRRKDFGKMGSKSNHGSSPGRTSPNHFEMSGGRRGCRNCAPPEDSPKYCY
jgi:hypothetical protein